MSRTRKGRKGPGYEYWSRRPGNKNGGLVGPLQKRFTHRAERRQGKDEIAAETIPQPHDWQADECQGCPLCICRKCGNMIVSNLDPYTLQPAVLECIGCGYQPEEQFEE